MIYTYCLKYTHHHHRRRRRCRHRHHHHHHHHHHHPRHHHHHHHWNCGLLSPNCHIYTKLKGDLIHSATCFLGLNQRNYPDNGSNLLGLVFSNFADLSVDHAEHGPVQPDHLRTPFIVDCEMPVRRCKQNFNISYERFSAGDYAVLYNALSTYD
jgi:hypothetical protein